MIVDNAISIDEGGLWELGIAFPISNSNMERFEFHTTLSDGVTRPNSTAILIDTQNLTRIARHSLIFIGPSTDTTRDTNGDLIYYGKSEFFLVSEFYSNAIVLEAFASGFSNSLQNLYVKGDPVTVRAIAESWDYLASSDFSDVTVLGSGFQYNRQDSIDDYKLYSQEVKVLEYPSGTTHRGIVQDFDDNTRSLLNRLANKKARMSAWMKASLSLNSNVIGNPIDEDVTGQVESNEIDEGNGVIVDRSGWSNPIDEMHPQDTSVASYIVPTIRATFYDDPALSSVISGADYKETVTDIQSSTSNMFLSKVFDVPEGVLSGRVAAYGAFADVVGLEGARILVDDFVLEHCTGTSKEDDGFYKVDINPEIGMSDSNLTKIKSSKDLSGIKIKQGRGDPTLRLQISCVWQNRPGYFIEDMRILEAWNKEGYSIVLRMKMPATMPMTIFCNMKVDSNYIKGRAGTEKADVSIVFEEVAA
jgi:hypothetical protein